MSRKTHLWTSADKRLLRRLYPDKPTAAIARRLQLPVERVYATANRLGLKKSAAFLASPAAHRLDGVIGKASRFQKGHVPANKGLRRPGWGPGRMKETQFKKGSISKRWDPEIYCIGALRISSDGYLNIKVRHGLRGWDFLNRHVWETERGPIPRGLVIRPINGDQDDTRIENLRLMTRKALMRENTIHNLPKPIAHAIQLRGALNRQINRLEKRNAEHA